MKQMTIETRRRLGATFHEGSGEKPKPPTFALATEIDRAIDLSCRACGAMAMGAGLGFPVGVSALLRFPPPTSDSFGLTLVAFECPGCIRSAFGLTIVASERPRCVWNYYSSVSALAIHSASEAHLDLL